MDRQQAIKERTLEEALFITKNKATIRQTAANSDVSKSTTHRLNCTTAKLFTFIGKKSSENS